MNKDIGTAVPWVTRFKIYRPFHSSKFQVIKTGPQEKAWEWGQAGMRNEEENNKHSIPHELTVYVQNEHYILHCLRCSTYCHLSLSCHFWSICVQRADSECNTAGASLTEWQNNIPICWLQEEYNEWRSKDELVHTAEGLPLSTVYKPSCLNLLKIHPWAINVTPQRRGWCTLLTVV